MTSTFKTIWRIFFLLLMIVTEAKGHRSIRYSSPELVSDGVDDIRAHQAFNLLLKGIDSAGEECEQMYGFLPCSSNIFGHLFLILVYEYLLFHGESYLAAGGERIFKILGPGVFGASAFHVLGALPEALLLLGTPFRILYFPFLFPSKITKSIDLENVQYKCIFIILCSIRFNT